MEFFKDIEETKREVLKTIENPSITYEQVTSRLAKIAENQIPYPNSLDKDFFKLAEKEIICDLDEGHAPYAPRYILPDYEKLMKEGCEFLRLSAPQNLTEAINSLLIFYHHVPSVTRYPVYIGSIDKLLDPFIEDEKSAREQIKWFLIHLDRTINDSFCHANIGPEETLAGNLIIELTKELENVTPNMTLLYDEEKTSEIFAKKCIDSSLISANPAFANDKMFRRDFQGDYGIASCYNGLPIGGGAFTLSRLRLNKIADNSKDIDDFFTNILPQSIDLMCNFMESKIKFLVKKTPFFENNFLAKEGFIDIDRFVGLFGLVGMHECVNKLMGFKNKTYRYGRDKEANDLGIEIMDLILARLNSFESKYSKFWDNRFMLHSQVGAANDKGTTAGVRIKIGEEIPIYDHLRQAGLFHKYFPSGIGDHFPFDYTAKTNPQAVLDLFKGSFKSGMRYISAYPEDGDLIRVTGYLIKKSDLEDFRNGRQISYDTVQYANDAVVDYGVLDRLVRNTND